MAASAFSGRSARRRVPRRPEPRGLARAAARSALASGAGFARRPPACRAGPVAVSARIWVSPTAPSRSSLARASGGRRSRAGPCPRSGPGHALLRGASICGASAPPAAPWPRSRRALCVDHVAVAGRRTRLELALAVGRVGPGVVPQIRAGCRSAGRRRLGAAGTARAGDGEHHEDQNGAQHRPPQTVNPARGAAPVDQRSDEGGRFSWKMLPKCCLATPGQDCPSGRWRTQPLNAVVRCAQ